jgi:hypothetical protein
MDDFQDTLDGIIPPELDIDAVGMSNPLDWSLLATHFLDELDETSSSSTASGYQHMSEVAPLPAAKSGYTRSPTEKMLLLCVACSRELGAGTDRLEKSVWASKCGHVYCGACAAGIRASKQRSNRGRGRNVRVQSGKPVQCVVPSCKTPLSAVKAMWEVFL